MAWAAVNAENDNIRKSARNGFEWLTVVTAERKPLSWQREPSALKQLNWLAFGVCDQCVSNEQGRMAQVIAEMKPYKLDILGINESGWTTSGTMRTTAGETVLYSRREDDSHHEGCDLWGVMCSDHGRLNWTHDNSGDAVTGWREGETNYQRTRQFQVYSNDNSGNIFASDCVGTLYFAWGS